MGAVGGAVDLVKVGQVGVVIVRGLESPKDLQQKAWLGVVWHGLAFFRISKVWA